MFNQLSEKIALKSNLTTKQNRETYIVKTYDIDGKRNKKLGIPPFLVFRNHLQIEFAYYVNLWYNRKWYR